jgi:hypothetical protein
LVKASDAAPEPFYNAHRDRSDLFSSARGEGVVNLDRHSRAVFGNGWYPANDLPPVARWMSGRSSLRFEAGPFTRLSLRLTTHIPDLRTSPMLLEFRLNGVLLCELCLFDYGWLELTIDVPEAVTRSNTDFKIEIHADRTWQPCFANPNSSDDRHLSIAVCNLEIS